MENKKCRICKKVKTISNFYYNKKYKDNHKNSCKECENKGAMVLYYKKRGEKKCKSCGKVLKDRKQYCVYCIKERIRGQRRKYLKIKYSNSAFRKKESLRKKEWYLKREKMNK